MMTVLLLVLITLIPALELRASIPYGVLINTELQWGTVAGICVLANIILGFGVFWIMGPCFNFLRQWDWFERVIWPGLEKTQRKLHPYVEKYGELGVALFIGIPLPGSGVYTGAFGSYLLGLNRRKFVIANLIGVLIAGTAVTAISLMVRYGAVGEDSLWARLCTKQIGEEHGQTNAVPVPGALHDETSGE